MNFGGVFEGRGTEMCTFGLSGCRVKPRRLRGRLKAAPKRDQEIVYFCNCEREGRELMQRFEGYDNDKSLFIAILGKAQSATLRCDPESSASLLRRSK